MLSTLLSLMTEVVVMSFAVRAQFLAIHVAL